MSTRKQGDYRKPPALLDELEIKVRFSPDGQVSVFTAGRSQLRRPSLWAKTEHFEGDDRIYGPYDYASHVILAVAQDRPNTLERFEFSLNGGVHGHQLEAFPGY